MASPVKIWRDQKKIATLIGKTGKIISWTQVFTPPAGFEQQAPYPVALIKLDGGGTIIAQIVDYEKNDLKFGRRVVTLVRRTIQPQGEDVISYGIKARPA